MGSRNIILSLAANIARILPDPYKRALYRNPSFSRVIRGGLNIASPVGMSEVTIAAGKLEKVAITACMRKLLTMLNAIVRKNEPWHSIPA